jgi:hypothetical protein
VETYNAVTDGKGKHKHKRQFIEAIAPLPKTQTQYRARRRSILHSDAFLVVQWLNAAKGTASYQRVLRVRRKLEALGAMLGDLRKRLAEGRASRDVAGMPEFARFAERFRKRHNAFNRSLARYAHVPAFAYNIESGVWRFSMVPARPCGREIKLANQYLTVRVNESSVVAALARLAANGELYKVRLCEQCGERWRVSERLRDRFCSQECREAFYVKSPGYHERKAANQARYREGLKENIDRHAAYLEGENHAEATKA